MPNASAPLEKFNIPSVLEPNRFSEPITLSKEARGLALYHRLERGGYLTRKEERAEGGFGRAIDAIFQPEVIHLRKVDVSCSIITAIKRKNPLCLINPIVLNVSW